MTLVPVIRKNKKGGQIMVINGAARNTGLQKMKSQVKTEERHDEHEEEHGAVKDSFTSGLKLGLSFSLDPIGAGMESFEQTFINGKCARGNKFKSAFMEVSEGVHGDKSVSRYFGEATGLLIGGALQGVTGGAIALATGLISTGAGLYGIAKTIIANSEVRHDDHDHDHDQEVPDGTFKEGLKGGFGIAIDPFGMAAETTNSLLIDGKCIRHNDIRTIGEDMSTEAHNSKWNLEKALGMTAGYIGGTACNVVTGGLLPLGTAMADIWKTLKN